MSELWGKVCLELKDSVGADDYRNWISGVNLVAVDGGVAVLEAATPFYADWVEQNYGETILGHLRTHERSVVRVRVRARNGVAAAHCASATPPRVDADWPLSLRLDTRFTFSNFVVGKPNEVAHAAAWSAAESDKIDFNPLFLYGGVGLGKTHLMHAVGAAVKAKTPDAKVMYLSAEQFMVRFVQALKKGAGIEFKETFRSADVLMVDDVQFIADKNSTQEEFFHTFNALISENKKIILSGDRSPGQIEGLSNRIKSRLQSGLVAVLHPTDYELRLGILQRKAEDVARERGVQISEAVLDLLARRIQSNVRVLEGALTRLIAHTALVGEMTVEIARDALADLLRETDHKLELDEILRVVADFYTLRQAEITGPRRSKDIVRARQIAIYLAKQLTTKSLPEIGRRFGGRDHTTIIHSINRIQALKSEIDEIEQDLKILRHKLQG